MTDHTLTVIQLRDPRNKEKWLQLDDNNTIHFNLNRNNLLRIEKDKITSSVLNSTPSIHIQSGGFPSNCDNVLSTGGAVLAVDKNGVLVSMDKRGVIRRYMLSDEPVNLGDVNSNVKSPEDLIQELDKKTTDQLQYIICQIDDLKQKIKNIDTLHEKVEVIKIDIDGVKKNIADDTNSNVKNPVMVKPASANTDAEDDSWFDRVKDKIADITSDKDTEAREQIDRLDKWLQGVSEHVQNLVDDNRVNVLKTNVDEIKKLVDSLNVDEIKKQLHETCDKIYTALGELNSVSSEHTTKLNDLDCKLTVHSDTLNASIASIQANVLNANIHNDDLEIKLEAVNEQTKQLYQIQTQMNEEHDATFDGIRKEHASFVQEQKSVFTAVDKCVTDLSNSVSTKNLEQDTATQKIQASIININSDIAQMRSVLSQYVDKKDIDKINQKLELLLNLSSTIATIKDSMDKQASLCVYQSGDINLIKSDINKLNLLISQIHNDIQQTRKVIDAEAESRTLLSNSVSEISNLANINKNLIHNMSVSIDTKEVKLSKDLILRADKDGHLVSKANNDQYKYYVSSEMFKSKDSLFEGDIVGLDNNGMLEKVLGGKWCNSVYYGNASSVITSYWDSYDINQDLHMYVEKSDQRLILKVSQCNSGELSVVSTSTITLCDNIDSSKQYVSSIVKVNSTPHRYVVGFSEHGEAIDVSLVKLRIDIEQGVIKISEVNKNTTYTGTSQLETFSLVYDTTSSIDILVLVGYSAINSNLECCLFAVHPESNSDIEIGYSQSNCCSENIVMDGIKAIKMMVITGDVVVCAYGNYKTFIMLPVSYDAAFTFNKDGYLDVESAECVDIIYDPINSNVISVEKTLSNIAYLRVLDISSDIKPIRTKKLGNISMIPLGLNYNDVLDQFVLVYSDSECKGQLSSQLFSHNGEEIIIGLSYRRGESDIMYQVVENTDSIIPVYGKTIYSRCGSSLHTIDITCDDGNAYSLSFHDNYGIPATAFIGIVENKCDPEDMVRVALKGRIFSGNIKLPQQYIGKQIYMDSESMGNKFPNNITTRACGNVLIGTCLSRSKIMVGL